MVFLDKIDTAPLQSTDFNFEFYNWIASLVDTLNETFTEIEGLFNNGIVFPSYTTDEIEAMAATAANGTGWYCTDSSPPNIVFLIDGSLVQITTSAFP